jgi:hypothetical protein
VRFSAFLSSSSAGLLRNPGRDEQPGRAVQVDPVKLTLKAPGSKRLTLKYDGLISTFAFNFNLRRYSPELRCFCDEDMLVELAGPGGI